MLSNARAEEIFESLYKSTDGYAVSRDARLNANLDSSQLLYGEMPFTTWVKILEIVKPKIGGNFLDLGSGTGRVVMQSYLLGIFKNCVGVELLDGLHQKAAEKLSEFQINFAQESKILAKEVNLKLIRDNLFNVSFKEADLIFMNHPFKEGENFDKLEEKLISELKPGTKIITTIRKLKNTKFKNKFEHNFEFSWGHSTAYYFEFQG